MSSVNKVTLIGNLGRDPEMRYMPNGDAVANVSIATTSSYKDKEGKKIETTEWHRTVFFGKLAEIVGEYCKKGSQIYVEGALRTRKWQDKDGVEKYTTEVVGGEMKLLGGRPTNTGDAPAPEGEAGGAKGGKTEAKQPVAAGADQDDIPF